MNQDLKNLLTLYENKMASMWQLDGEMYWCEGDRFYKMGHRMRILDEEVKTARQNLISKIEELTNAG